MSPTFDPTVPPAPAGGGNQEVNMLQKYDDSNPANQIELTGRFVWSHPAHMIATFFGAGCRPRRQAPMARLRRACLHRAVARHDDGRLGDSFDCALHRRCLASDKVAADLGVEDHKGIVVDEVVGIWLLFAFLPAGTLWWIAGFAAFRFFDIMKLPPVDIIDEKMKNGVGVMLDDVVAAFYAWVVVSILGWLFG